MFPLERRFKLIDKKNKEMAKTLIIGASENPARYSFLAANMLLANGHQIALLGKKPGFIKGIPIQTGHPELKEIDTVTMYIGPLNQPHLYQYIIDLHPRRVIFNPGTENEEFSSLLSAKDIQTEEACTLVLLRIGMY